MTLYCTIQISPPSRTWMVLLLAFTWAAGCSSNPPQKGEPIASNTEGARRANERAISLMQQKDYAGAEAALREAITADSSFGPAHGNLGSVYFKQGKLYDAAWEFERAIKLMPTRAEPRNNLGLVYMSARKYDKAAENFERAHQLQPDNYEYTANLALARVSRHDDDSLTRSLLEEVSFRDPRPQWQSWATMSLMRFRSHSAPAIPSTLPAEPAPAMPATRPTATAVRPATAPVVVRAAPQTPSPATRPVAVVARAATRPASTQPARPPAVTAAKVTAK